MKKSSYISVVLMFILLPLFLRLWGLADFPSYRGDEAMHVPTAKNYVERGHLTPENWYQPPLRHILLYGSMKIFGDNPYGWRMRNVLLGTFSVFILFLLGKELFHDQRIAYTAALLLSLDPLHMLFSRSTFGGIPALFFILICIYSTVRYIKGSIHSLFVSGVFLGLALSMKQYYIPALFTLIAFTIICKHRDGTLSRSTVIHILLAFLVLPISVYILTFYAWLGRGYTLPEFFQLQVNAYRAHQGLTVENFHSFLAVSSSPWVWFVKPIIYGFQIKTEGIWGQFHIFMNNWPVWVLTVPSTLYVAYLMWRKKDRYVSLIFIVFVLSYLQLLLLKRPLFLYSSIPLLPFALLIIAFTVVTVINKYQKKVLYFRIVCSFIVVWGLYLYPLATDKSVPLFLYAPLLAKTKIFYPF
jgi:4-amino-4-deoxy-L-arabinose transferase-like glycosyltransferase